MPHDMAQTSESTVSNPFTSFPSSPVVGYDTSRDQSSSTYTPVEVEVKHHSLTSAPRIQPAPPSRVHRQSYQSSRHSSRPVSQLPRITDPEKAAHARIWQDAVDGFEKPYLCETTAEINAQCLRVLLYLSGPVFLMSILLAIWTVVGLVCAVLLQPINTLRKTKTFREQTVDLLAPSLKIHLSCILSFVRDETYASYSLPMLITINLIAPLISIVVVLAAWTAACFWVYAAILGDPEGLDRESRRSSYLKEEEEDGKASALRVRRWWRSLLVRPLR